MRFYIFVILFFCCLINLQQLYTKTQNELSEIINIHTNINNIPITHQKTKINEDDLDKCMYPELFEVNIATKKCDTKKSHVCEGGNLLKFKHQWACANCPNGTYPGYEDLYNKKSLPICKQYDNLHTKHKNIQSTPKNDLVTPRDLNVNNIKFISKDFNNNILKTVKNPCTFDVLTGDVIENAKLITNSDGIASCITTNSDVVTVLIEHDYLTNNNGLYANGVIRISDKSAQFSIVEFDEKTKRPLRVGYAYVWDDIFPWVKNAFSMTKQENSKYAYIFNAISPKGMYNYPVNDFLDKETLYFEKATIQSPKPGPNTLYGFHTTMIGGQMYPLIHCWDLGTDRVDARDDQGLEIKRTLFSHERDNLRQTGYAVCIDHEGLKLNPDYQNLSGVIVFKKNLIESDWFGTQKEREKYIPQIRYTRDS